MPHLALTLVQEVSVVHPGIWPSICARALAMAAAVRAAAAVVAGLLSLSQWLLALALGLAAPGAEAAAEVALLRELQAALRLRLLCVVGQKQQLQLQLRRRQMPYQAQHQAALDQPLKHSWAVQQSSPVDEQLLVLHLPALLGQQLCRHCTLRRTLRWLWQWLAQPMLPLTHPAAAAALRYPHLQLLPLQLLHRHRLRHRLRQLRLLRLAPVQGQVQVQTPRWVRCGVSGLPSLPRQHQLHHQLHHQLQVQLHRHRRAKCLLPLLLASPARLSRCSRSRSRKLQLCHQQQQ